MPKTKRKSEAYQAPDIDKIFSDAIKNYSSSRLPFELPSKTNLYAGAQRGRFIELSILFEEHMKQNDEQTLILLKEAYQINTGRYINSRKTKGVDKQFNSKTHEIKTALNIDSPEKWEEIRNLFYKKHTNLLIKEPKTDSISPVKRASASKSKTLSLLLCCSGAQPTVVNDDEENEAKLLTS